MTFGQRYTDADSVGARLELERQERRRETFAQIDAVLRELVRAALSGEKVGAAEVDDADAYTRGATITLEVGAEQRAALTDHFNLDSQEGRGSWNIPEADTIALGTLNVGHWAKVQPRLALNQVVLERNNGSLRESPAAVALWSLAPLFTDLYLPLRLRAGFWLGDRTVEQQEKSWKTIDQLYQALGIDMAAAARYRPRTGWATITAQDAVSRRQALLASWEAVASDAYDRYRTLKVGPARREVLRESEKRPGSAPGCHQQGHGPRYHRVLRRQLACVPGLPWRAAP